MKDENGNMRYWYRYNIVDGDNEENFSLRAYIFGTWYDEGGNKNILSEDGTFEVSDAGELYARGTYTISGEVVAFITEKGEQYAFTIVELTKDELCVEWEDGAMQRLHRDA